MRKLIARSIEIIRKPSSLLAIALVLAGSAGAMTAVAALGTSSAEPTRTVTVNIENGQPGPPGPAGPPGPQGEPGDADCPAGFSFAVLVINAPNGQVTIATCIKDSA